MHLPSILDKNKGVNAHFELKNTTNQNFTELINNRYEDGVGEMTDHWSTANVVRKNLSDIFTFWLDHLTSTERGENSIRLILDD